MLGLAYVRVRLRSRSRPSRRVDLVAKSTAAIALLILLFSLMTVGLVPAHAKCPGIPPGVLMVPTITI